MPALDPLSATGPAWWTGLTSQKLREFEDEALPPRHVRPAEPLGADEDTLVVARSLLTALWALAGAGGPDSEEAHSALRDVEFAADCAARAARDVLALRTTRDDDDANALEDRDWERSRPSFGPPATHLLEATFTVRLPGYGADTVTGSVRVDGDGALDLTGNGPLHETDVRGHLDARAVARSIEALVDGQLAQRDLRAARTSPSTA
ncbi:hypothetical protein ABT160_14050 [Streptomyces sp. NPDC001941]|uniref:hypothetical protein n=1 Tax=Streptomyces sp. NPDC001941 TaxID=3154659 RepID=UPI003320E8F6